MAEYAGRLIELYIEDGTTIGIIEADGMLRKALMTLRLDARVYDEILVESGMAVTVLREGAEKHRSHVLGYAGRERHN